MPETQRTYRGNLFLRSMWFRHQIVDSLKTGSGEMYSSVRLATSCYRGGSGPSGDRSDKWSMAPCA